MQNAKKALKEDFNMSDAEIEGAKLEMLIKGAQADSDDVRELVDNFEKQTGYRAIVFKDVHGRVSHITVM